MGVMNIINAERLQRTHSCVVQDLQLLCSQCAVISGHGRREDSYICPSAATRNYRFPVSPAPTLRLFDYFMA